MEYTLNRQAVTVNEVVFDSVQEQPVDLDVTLPDYCPDIQKILKCQIYPCVTAKSILSDSLEVSGSVTLRLLYLDAGGSQIRCYENSSPFSMTVSLRRSVGNALAYTTTQVEYVNCRAASPRRLDIHGAFSLRAKVVEQAETRVLCGIEGDDVQQRRQKIAVSRVAGASQQQFSLEEVLELGGGKPPAETVLRTDAVVDVDDVKTLDNKVIVKGNVRVKVLYLSGLGDGAPETMEYAIPYSQMLDCAGVGDSCDCDVQVDVMHTRVGLKSDSSGENMLMDVEVRLIAYINAYEDTELEIVTDVYSTKYEVSVEQEQKSFMKLLCSVEDSCPQKNTFPFEESGISKVIDVWNESSQVTAQLEEGNLLYKGRFNLCLLALNGDGKPFYFERMLEFRYGRESDQGTEDLRCDCSVSVGNISYRLTGTAGIEVKTDLRLEATLYRQSLYRVISEAAPNEEQPKSRDEQAALILYYAGAGEDLWGIAREYCTSVEAIQKENGLESEQQQVAEAGMLLIPV